MTPLSVTTLLDLPYLRITWEETGELVFAAGVSVSDAEAILVLGTRALMIEMGR